MPATSLIFDVDGTLAETERDGHRVAFNLAFTEAGLDWHWDVAAYGRLLCVTGGKERLLCHWQRVDPAGAALPGAWDAVCDLHRRKTRLYADIVSSGRIALRDGVRRLLDEAMGRGLRLAIATTTSPENVEVLVRRSLGVAPGDLFECIGAADSVTRKKPAPDIYRWVMGQMRLDPADCVAFEDSRAGAQAACGAAIPTIVTRGEYSRGVVFPEALAVLDGLGEPGRPANGIVAGQRWSGAVGVDEVLDWTRAA